MTDEMLAKDLRELKGIGQNVAIADKIKGTWANNFKTAEAEIESQIAWLNKFWEEKQVEIRKLQLRDTHKESLSYWERRDLEIYTDEYFAAAIATTPHIRERFHRSVAQTRNALIHCQLHNQISERELPPDFWGKAGQYMNGADWRYVRDSDNPIVTLASIYNNPELQSAYDKPYGEYYRVDTWNVPRTGITLLSVAEIARLPLVYQTDIHTLLSIMIDGFVKTDRKVQTQQKGSLLPPKTSTIASDRDVGLDDYVFTHLGNPGPRSYGDVEILFRPERLFSNDGSFATETEHAEIPDSGDNSNTRFFKQISTGFQFARRHAANQLSRNYYAEIKSPILTTDEISAIVFTKKDDLSAFVRDYPDAPYRIILKPDINHIATALDLEARLGTDLLHMAPPDWIVNEARKHLSNSQQTNPVGYEKEKVRILGDTHVPDSLHIDYSLPRSESARLQAHIIDHELNSQGAERIRKYDSVPQEHFTDFYLFVHCPDAAVPHIRAESNIYLLSPSEYLWGTEVEHCQPHHAERKGKILRLRALSSEVHKLTEHKRNRFSYDNLPRLTIYKVVEVVSS